MLFEILFFKNRLPEKDSKNHQKNVSKICHLKKGRLLNTKYSSLLFGGEKTLGSMESTGSIYGSWYTRIIVDEISDCKHFALLFYGFKLIRFFISNLPHPNKLYET